MKQLFILSLALIGSAWGSGPDLCGSGGTVTSYASPQTTVSASVALAGFQWTSGSLTAPTFTVSGWNGNVPTAIVVAKSDYITTAASLKVLNQDFTVAKTDPTTLSVATSFLVPARTPVTFCNTYGGGSLLRGATPNHYTTPSGWTLIKKEDFERASLGAGEYSSSSNSTFTSVQFHNDGNPARNRSYRVGDWSWTLPSGTAEVYVSFYQYLDSSFRQNDEIFLYHIYRHPSTGAPTFVENILDYFQNSNGQYNSSDGQFLWNIQGSVVDPNTGRYYQQDVIAHSAAMGTINWPIPTGRWVQWEIRQKFNTVHKFPTIAGTVIVNAAAKTFTRSQGSWIADGVTVNMVLGFTGFANRSFCCGNNNSFKVIAVGDDGKTITVADPGSNLASETSTPGAINYGYSNQDGTYEISRDGVKLGQGSGMNFSGAPSSFADSNTQLQLFGAYTKVIWRLPIKGNSCQEQDTHAPWIGACAIKIGGNCGYQTISGGWGANCKDDGGRGSYIGCTGNGAGTPMPCPPVFNQYVDDIIVLARMNSAADDPPTVGKTGLSEGPGLRPSVSHGEGVSIGGETATADACDSPANCVPSGARTATVSNVRAAIAPASYCGTSNTSVCGKENGLSDYWDAAFPGYVKFRYGRGAPNCGAAGAGCQGIYNFWDMKNDPNLLYNMWTVDNGLFQHQWNEIKNADGSLRVHELKEPGGPDQIVTINEQNNVRMKWTQAGAAHAYGAAQYPSDPHIRITKTFVAYRHGTGTGVGAGKIYTTTTFLYDGLDERGPLTINDGPYWYLDIGWWKISGESDPANQNTRVGCAQLQPFTPSPFNNVYEAPGDYRNKHWILVSANVSNNSPNSGERFSGSSPCWNPSGPNDGSPGQLPAGRVTRCTKPNGPAGCASYPQPDSGIVLHTNYLQVSYESLCSYMPLGRGSAVYFEGGLRFNCHYGVKPVAAGQPQTVRNAGFIGDNGITTEAMANAFAAEYIGSAVHSVAAPRISGASFDPSEGYWLLSAAAAGAGFSPTGNTLHSPAFNLTEWNGEVPSTISVGGVTKNIDVDFVAAKRDANTLLLQALFDIPAGSKIVLGPSRGTTSVGSCSNSTSNGCCFAIWDKAESRKLE
ncbi:MAG TPA: hypothetical protein VK473_00730 [Terriglobales bacterium]|nr:hypothetical protein [Terriglobales bacterium]